MGLKRDVVLRSLGLVLTVAGAEEVSLSETAVLLSTPDEADRVRAWLEVEGLALTVGTESLLVIVSLRDRKDSSPCCASRLGRDRMVGTSCRGAGASVRASVRASVFWYLSVVGLLSDDGAGCLVVEAASLGVGLAAGGAIVLVDVVEADLVGRVAVDVTVVVEDAGGTAAAGLLWARCWAAKL